MLALMYIAAAIAAPLEFGSSLQPAGGCVSALDCSLNGVCDNGSCACDQPWSGVACETMNFKPVTFPQGYGVAPNISTWGGGIIYDGTKHHMFVSRMSNNCLLRAYQNNSRIDHAVSTTGAVGPYVFHDVAVNTFAHNAAPVTLHDGTYAIYHVGSGLGAPDGGNNCTAPDGDAQQRTKWANARHNAFGNAHHISFGIHVSSSLNGPWAAVNHSTISACNNPAPWVHSNGTIFLNCGGKLLRAEHPAGPYTTVAAMGPNRSTGPHGNYEDPQIYLDKRGYFHCLYHVFRYNVNSSYCGDETVSAHQFSEDGFTWRMSRTQPYNNHIELTTGGAVIGNPPSFNLSSHPYPHPTSHPSPHPPLPLRLCHCRHARAT
jgi:hypothetical protein